MLRCKHKDRSPKFLTLYWKNINTTLFTLRIDLTNNMHLNSYFKMDFFIILIKIQFCCDTGVKILNFDDLNAFSNHFFYYSFHPHED